MATEEESIDGMQGALDWAYSIQARYAESLAADLVAVAQARVASGEPDNSPHMVRVRANMAAVGIDSSIVWEPPDPHHELDDAWVRGSISPLVSQLRSVLPAEKSAKLDKLILSSLPSGAVSAFCATNSWDDFNYVFMDAELLIFCQLASKILAVCIDPMLDEKLAVQKVTSRRPLDVARSPFIIDKMADLYSATVVKGVVRGAKPWVPSPRQTITAVLITRAMMMFVVSHELCHVLAGHFERATGFATAITGETAEGLAFSHADEFEADGMGITLALTALTSTRPIPVYEAIAPYAFLKFIAYLYTVQAIFGVGGDIAMSSHPLPEDRAARVRTALIPLLAQDSTLEPMLTRVDQIFFQMARHTTPILERMAKSGAKPRQRQRQNLLGEDRPAILGIQPLPADGVPPVDDWRARLGVQLAQEAGES